MYSDLRERAPTTGSVWNCERLQSVQSDSILRNIRCGLVLTAGWRSEGERTVAFPRKHVARTEDK